MGKIRILVAPKKPRMKNRWLIALAAVGIHISIGSIYAWSMLNAPLLDHFELGSHHLTKITWTFTLSVFFYGFSSAFLGKFVQRHGPRWTGRMAALLFGLGLIGTGVAIQLKWLWGMYIFYGAIAGTGVSIGYIAPVATLVKWFPDKRGFATGLAIMGFGFASFIASYIIGFLLDLSNVGLERLFYVLGLGYGLIILLSANYLAPPPADYCPEGYDPHHKDEQSKKPIAELSAKEALRQPHFYLLWFMLFVIITCGVGVISVAKDMASLRMSAIAATSTVAIMGIFNGLGRIAWSSFSDVIGRPVTWVLFFVIQIPLFFILPSLQTPLLFQIAVFIIMTCYGGSLASIPAFLSDRFGTKELATIHGYILTTLAIAAITGIPLTSWIYDQTGSFTSTMHIFGIALSATSIIAIILLFQIRNLRKQP